MTAADRCPTIEPCLPVYPCATASFSLLRMERAQAEGNLEFVETNMPRLERLIQQHMDRSHELAQLQQRARDVRDRHEPLAT